MNELGENLLVLGALCVLRDAEPLPGRWVGGLAHHWVGLRHLEPDHQQAGCRVDRQPVQEAAVDPLKLVARKPDPGGVLGDVLFDARADLARPLPQRREFGPGCACERGARPNEPVDACGDQPGLLRRERGRQGLEELDLLEECGALEDPVPELLQRLFGGAGGGADGLGLGRGAGAAAIRWEGALGRLGRGDAVGGGPRRQDGLEAGLLRTVGRGSQGGRRSRAGGPGG